MKTKLAFAVAASAVLLVGCGSQNESSSESTTSPSNPATAGAESACLERMGDLAETAVDPIYSEVITSDHGNGMYYTTGRLQGTLKSSGAFDYSFNCATTQTGGTYNANLDVDYTNGNP
jgi:hypothetical protein